MLEEVKQNLGITGTFQDKTIQGYIDEVKEFMLEGGVAKGVVESDKCIGIITRGVADLWNYGSGGTSFSPYFIQRVSQLALVDATVDEKTIELIENGTFDIKGYEFAKVNVPEKVFKLQEKEVTPMKKIQEVICDSDYDALSKVTVESIPDEYIIPTGELEITSNGTYDVTDKVTVKVNTPITKLGTKNISDNGTYKASDDNLDGYSEVKVNITGDLLQELVDVRGNLNYLFAYDKTSTDLSFVASLDTSKAVAAKDMFYNSTVLETIPEFDFSGITMGTVNGQYSNGVYEIFKYCTTIKNVGGFVNLGKGYKTTDAGGTLEYTLDLTQLSLLTEQSIINILTKLYDIKTKGCKTQYIKLGTTNMDKLTSSEGQAALESAINKGWTVS